MHLQIATACQEDSFSYMALMQTFILQTGFSEAGTVLLLMNKKKNGWVGNAVMQAFQMRLGQHHIWISARRSRQAELRHASAASAPNWALGWRARRRSARSLCVPWLPSLQCSCLGEHWHWQSTVLQRSLIVPLLYYAETYGSTPTGKYRERNFAAIT